MAALTIGSVAAFGSPSLAGLGDAETQSQQSYDAYCGKIRNDCRVVFSGERLIVNDRDSITRSQFRGYNQREGQTYSIFGSTNGYTYHFLVRYEESGTVKTGEFIFVNRDTAKQFRTSLEAFSSQGYTREIGPTIEIEEISNPSAINKE